MNQADKERQFSYVAEIGLCIVLASLMALQVIPLALGILLCTVSFGSIIAINWWSDKE